MEGIFYLLGCPSDNPSMPPTTVVGAHVHPPSASSALAAGPPALSLSLREVVIAFSEPGSPHCACVTSTRGPVGWWLHMHLHGSPPCLTSRTPKVIMLMFSGHNHCFQGCLGPFGLGYSCCKAWCCLPRDGFTGDKDAVPLVLAALQAVPPYPSRQSTVHIPPISINFPPSI